MIGNTMTAATIARMPALALIRSYQWLVSPLVGKCCRFVPSCSEYAIGAIRKHGLFKGSILTVSRLCKCHPFHEGGWDPVP